MFATIVTGCYLGISSIGDIRRQTVCCFFSLVVALGGILFQCLAGGQWIAMVFGIVLSQILAFMAWVSKEAIGYGDVLCIFACSMWMEWTSLVAMVILAFFFAAIIGLALITAGKRKRTARIPFVPFLFLGFLCQLVGYI